MRRCILYPVRLPGPAIFEWRWRSAEQGKFSTQGFSLFYECFADARAQGYEIDMDASLAACKGGLDGHAE